MSYPIALRNQKMLLLTHCHILPDLDAVSTYSFENIVRKGEIACNKQFLLFSQCFLPYMALIFHFKCTLKCLYIAVENFVRKGEISCNKQFFLYLQCFVSYMELIFHFKCTLKVVCNLFQFGPV